MSKRLLCIWLPNWPIQRIQAEEPQLAETPLILSARDPRRGSIVAAANLAARAEGIRPAMRLAEASALVDAQIREHDPQEDIEALCGLAEQAQQFSPIVGLEQLDKKMWAGRTLHQPECLLLDISGLASLFGGEVELLGEISQWLRAQLYFACMGVANSLGAAWAIANHATRNRHFSTLNDAAARSEAGRPSTGTFEKGNRGQSCTASNDGDSKARDHSLTTAGYELPPCRYHIVPKGQDALAIAPLPLAALRQPSDTLESLQRLGIRTLGELASLPRDGMATRLGENLILRWDQALGLKTEPIVTLHSSPDWCLEQNLEYPTHHRETIAELVRRLTHELSIRLRKREEGALRILCRLDLVQSPPVLLQLALFRPTNDAAHLSILLGGQLEQQFRQMSKNRLWRLSLQATLTAPMRWRQAELFDAGEVRHQHDIARLVDTLSGRLGRKQVLEARLRREAQPERAFTLQPLTGRRRDGSRQATVKKLSTRLSKQRIEPSRDDPLRRPSQLFVQPVAISVDFRDSVNRRHDCFYEQDKADRENSVPQRRPQCSVTPEEQIPKFAVAPRAFEYQAVWYDVVSTCGPERLESGWWRGPSTRRDYFRVETGQGSWWWIFRDLNSGSWFVHGKFD